MLTFREVNLEIILLDLGFVAEINANSGEQPSYEGLLSKEFAMKSGLGSCFCRLLVFAVAVSAYLLAAPMLWAADGVADPTSPAKVFAVRKNKRGPYLVFDQGSKTGFVIGRDVCFYDAESQKITCASIVRTKPRAGAAYITAEEAEKIKPGFYVWPQDMGTFKIQPKMTDDKDADELDIERLIAEEDDPPEIILPPLLRPRLQLHLSPTYALPIWMNDLRFNSSARASGFGEIWEPGDTIKGSVVGFGVRYYMALAGRGDSSLDFTYHFVPQRPVKDDFDVTNAAIAVKSMVWSHHYRLRWMRGATWKHDELTDLLLYAGLGYDFMQAKFKSEKVGAAVGNLVDGTIRAHALELPLIVTWQRYFGRWLFSAGADASLPIGLFGVDASGKLAYDEETADADKSFDGAVDAVNVRRGWFALALQFGVGTTF